jgi:hypothetical protein
LRPQGARRRESTFRKVLGIRSSAL